MPASFVVRSRQDLRILDADSSALLASGLDRLDMMRRLFIRLFKATSELQDVILGTMENSNPAIPQAVMGDDQCAVVLAFYIAARSEVLQRLALREQVLLASVTANGFAANLRLGLEHLFQARQLSSFVRNLPAVAFLKTAGYLLPEPHVVIEILLHRAAARIRPSRSGFRRRPGPASPVAPV
jgi:hypothetical protein